jgi:hypothetical protein
MNITVNEFLLWIISQLIVAAGIWGGIRADLRSLHDKANRAQAAADKAHERIDEVLARGDTGSFPPYREHRR